jgi:hypothetical protein
MYAFNTIPLIAFQFCYSDYRGLKKCIKEILRSQKEYEAHFSTTDSPPLGPQPRVPVAPGSVLPKNALGLHEVCDQWSVYSLWNEDPVTQRQERPFRPFSLISQISDLPLPRNALRTGIIPLPDLRNDDGNPFQAKQNRRFSVPPKRNIDRSAVSLPLSELFELLTSQERRFFTTLDEELRKVDTFLLTKEKSSNVETDF